MEKQSTLIRKRKEKNKIKDINLREYKSYIHDLLQNKEVLSMKDYKQHSDIHCLEHSLYVSYTSYVMCKKLRFDYASAARGGLLHDFFLYDWHVTKSPKGLHGFSHPNIALFNANKHFVLNAIEKDIIKKHMWPLTFMIPKYKEALVVALVDKYCATMEIFKRNKKTNVIYKRLMGANI